MKILDINNLLEQTNGEFYRALHYFFFANC
jgi:hypothetical protein